MSIEAMKQAQEPQCAHGIDQKECDWCRPAPKQEPVAWISHSQNLLSWDKFYDDMTPLYTAPRQWQGLTEEETQRLADKHLFYQPEGYEVSGVFALARAIEAKLKENNT